MAKKESHRELKAQYDADQDILYLTFTKRAQKAVAEEIGDEVFVRYDPQTHDVITIEFLNLSARLEQVFGKEMKFLELGRQERLLFPIKS
ncbi:MAG: hypothetical protein HDKAJFGB_02928 [Anaerolineae bacterium]|nr:hypothetical protein [Anaerolineae bacterium]MDL1896514.1 DUF2283 domain-containing protein [Anaerolineae bacterium CFX7]